jgi:hypothetical protein
MNVDSFKNFLLKMQEGKYVGVVSRVVTEVNVFN